MRRARAFSSSSNLIPKPRIEYGHLKIRRGKKANKIKNPFEIKRRQIISFPSYKFRLSRGSILNTRFE